MTGLTAAQLQTFYQEGVVCIADFLSDKEISRMMASANELLSNFDGKNHPLTQFKTGYNNHVGDQYFFDSSDKVSYFFDVDAFDENGILQFSKENSINKIGHGLHIHHDVFKEITFKERVKEIARDLKYTDPRVLQSMLIFKNGVDRKHEKYVELEASKAYNARNGRKNEVRAHTDGTFLYTEPQSALGFWFALQDCTVSNGCLSYHPGSHKTLPITKRFVRIDGGKKGCKMINVVHDEPVPKDDLRKYRSIECKAGSLILIHNSVLHKSEQNNSRNSRFAYTFHLIEGIYKYDELNWLQVPSSGGASFSSLY